MVSYILDLYISVALIINALIWFYYEEQVKEKGYLWAITIFIVAPFLVFSEDVRDYIDFEY